MFGATESGEAATQSSMSGANDGIRDAKAADDAMQLRFIADVALDERLFGIDDARQGREITAAEQAVDLGAGRQSFVRRRLKRCGRRTATARDAGETAWRVVHPDGGEQAEACRAQS